MPQRPLTIAFPLRLDSATGVGLVEEDTEEHVLGRCGLILATPLGWYDSVPAFGSPELLHDQAPTPASIRSAVQPWEPRVDELTVDQLTTLGETTINVTARADG
jgi:phage baseplate assembly protein W